jgi:DNA repair protein RadC
VPRAPVLPAVHVEVLESRVTHNSIQQRGQLPVFNADPTGSLNPSTEDLEITRKIIKASLIVDIQVHEHLIINTENEKYFSFTDQGIIRRFYDEIT